MRQKGFAPIFILLILLGVGLLAYFGYLYNPSTQPTPEPTSSSTPTTITSATPDPTANWITKTYSTYQIKYPTDLTANEREGSVFTISKWGATQTEGTELFDGFSITFQPRELPNVTPIEYANSRIKEMVDTGISEITAGPTQITVNGYNGVTFTQVGLGKYKHTVLSSKNGVMLMHISLLIADPGGIGFQKTIDQILSTFKFIQ